ncbi:hypothetical protein HYG81_18700 [Natrinema zhouii]|uniref:hypothetical protein n=1 Tax=Natrinema zhouii TaxID=1710539 RepID=UPI001D0003C3|nr:hypothetical protein [Natrinema zhouii]UHQ97965.1 hypothetical protein HYG81_18700 [Natrinema zhouii]
MVIDGSRREDRSPTGTGPTDRWATTSSERYPSRRRRIYPSSDGRRFDRPVG